MSSKALVEIFGPLKPVRDALLELDGAEAGDRDTLVKLDGEVLIVRYDRPEKATAIVVGGDDPDQAARDLYEALSGLPYAAQVTAADSAELLEQRSATKGRGDARRVG